MKNLEFIVRHYKEGCFNSKKTLRTILPVSPYKKYLVAASVSIIVLISVYAAGYYIQFRNETPPHRAAEPQVVTPIQNVETEIFDFENASLEYIISQIEAVYNVKITNLPENIESYTLTIYYEGTPEDLIEMINEILNTEMKVEEKL
ncbi:MAG: DUF4974 domain-containing protein [Bacteroides sp.]|nr:DUF4974 domain-containing protein [Bacteroides sp.]